MRREQRKRNERWQLAVKLFVPQSETHSRTVKLPRFDGHGNSLFSFEFPAPTISTGTLGFSRLARRSIFIVVCTLADSLYEPFASRPSTARSPCRVASTASGWNVSCRA